jgi:hypothetical protein
MTNRTARLVVCPALGLALATLAAPGRALAQDAPAEGTPPPAEGAAPPAAAAPSASSSGGGYLSPTDVTLRQGAISIDGDVVVNLSSGAVGKPVQIVPNLYYGANDALTIGFAQNPGAEIFQTTGSGLCITGSSNGCEHVYNNFSLDGLYSFMRSSTMDLAGHGGLDFVSLDPFQMSLRLGVKGKMLAGPVVIVVDPSLNIGLNDRTFNKEVLQLPARVGFMATPQLNIGASIGFIGPVDGFGDAYRLPIGLGAMFAVSNMVDVRAQFTLTDLTGHSTGSGATGSTGGAADGRALSVGAAYRM